MPLDCSDPANQALEYAMQLARQLQARLTLLHVTCLPPLVDVDIIAYMAQVEASA